MLRTINLSENCLNKVVEDDELVVVENNNLGQKLTELKKSKNHQNLAKHRKSKHYSKLSKFKKTILNKSEILVNLIVTTNADTTRYLIAKARIAFTQLRQAFTKAPIF